jgi:outer membrane protein, multidrug efflux system
MRRALSSMVLLSFVAACTVVGPDYERPQTDMPAAWRVDVTQAAALANARWWEQFNDPVLNALIDTALRENRDLRAAAARVDRFIGQLRTTRSQFYPQVGYGLDASRNRATEKGPTPLPPGTDPWYSLYQGALGATWQIDLFGRVQRETESAQAQVLSSEQGRRGVVLSVVTSVAASYIGLRALDRQLEIAEATEKNYAETLRIFELRFKGGVVSEVELAQVRSQYEQARAAIPLLEQQVAAQENLISILLGANPRAIERGRTIDALAAPGIPGGLPSSLLERRPDVQQAEQNLVAANANIGVAQSLYYPSFNLTGLLGLASAALGDFLSSGAGVVTLGAGLTGPIFTGGAIEGQVFASEAAQREAYEFYRQVILNALRETNDALVGTQKRTLESEAQRRRVVALRDYARLSRLRFDNGYAGYLEVLYAENELFSGELTAVQSSAARLTEYVNVYKAMGGGWIDEADKRAPKAKGFVETKVE